MIFNVGGSAHSKGHFPDFDFDGDWDLVDDGMVDRVQNWRIMLKSSGTITFRRLTTPVDIFCVGGGGGGYLHGGGGGYTATTKNQLLATRQPYTVTIGAGGGVGSTKGVRGGSTSFGSVISAEGGYGGYSDGQRGGDGGSGGGDYGGDGKSGDGGSDGSNGKANWYQAQNSDGVWEWWEHGPAGQGQGSTTREFGEEGATLYAGGGGGGCNQSSANNGGYGGEGGGGQGAGRGANSTAAATVGTVNTGGGGGGGTESLTSMAGGSGIIVIRNHR